MVNLFYQPILAYHDTGIKVNVVRYSIMNIKNVELLTQFKVFIAKKKCVLLCIKNISRYISILESFIPNMSISHKNPVWVRLQFKLQKFSFSK